MTSPFNLFFILLTSSLVLIKNHLFVTMLRPDFIKFRFCFRYYMVLKIKLVKKIGDSFRISFPNSCRSVWLLLTACENSLCMVNTFLQKIRVPTNVWRKWLVGEVFSQSGLSNFWKLKILMHERPKTKRKNHILGCIDYSLLYLQLIIIGWWNVLIGVGSAEIRMELMSLWKKTHCFSLWMIWTWSFLNNDEWTSDKFVYVIICSHCKAILRWISLKITIVYYEGVKIIVVDKFHCQWEFSTLYWQYFPRVSWFM